MFWDRTSLRGKSRRARNCTYATYQQIIFFSTDTNRYIFRTFL